MPIKTSLVRLIAAVTLLSVPGLTSSARAEVVEFLVDSAITRWSVRGAYFPIGLEGDLAAQLPGSNTVSLGVFWGIWAMFPRRETPPIVTPVPLFLAYAVLLTLGLVAAWWVSWRVGVRDFRPGPIGLAFSALVVGVFYANHVAALGLRPLVLLPIALSVALVPLYFHRRQRVAAVVTLFPGALHWSRLLVLFVMPLVATLVYAFAAATGMDRLPWLAPAVYATTGLAGIMMLVFAVAMILRKIAIQQSDEASES